MATRFYFPEVLAAPVAPPSPGAEWEHNNGVTRSLVTVADASTLTNRLYSPDAADDLTSKDSLHRQYVSDALGAQTISGNITGQFQASEANSANNLFLAAKILVVSNDGTTVRATLLAITRATSLELTAGGENNRTFPSTALTSYACTDGDRIVIEMGLGGTCTAAGGTNGHNGTMRWGCSASSGDLPVDETTSTTTWRPWMEFSNTLSFSTGQVNPPPITMKLSAMHRSFSW